MSEEMTKKKKKKLRAADAGTSVGTPVVETPSTAAPKKEKKNKAEKTTTEKPVVAKKEKKLVVKKTKKKTRYGVAAMAFQKSKRVFTVEELTAATNEVGMSQGQKDNPKESAQAASRMVEVAVALGIATTEDGKTFKKIG
jgi:hypothetical protein